MLLFLILWGIKLDFFLTILISWCRPFITMSFPLRTALVHPINFDMLIYQIYAMICWLSIFICLRKFYFSFDPLFVQQNLWIFQFSSYNWFLASYHVVRKDAGYDLNLLKFIRTCFVAYYIIYPGEYSRMECSWYVC